MAKQEKKESAGSGKYVVIQKLKEKLSAITPSENEKSSIYTNTSLLLEGIHFSLVYFPLTHLGYKAVVSAISGIYNKGGVPGSVSVNLGISTRHKIEDIETLFEGVDFACKKFNLKLTDIYVESSLTGLTLAVTSTGGPSAYIDKVSEIGDNDLICVTGDLGAAYMGLNILERERKVFEETGGAQPLLKGYEYAIGRQLKPDIPVKALAQLREKGIKTTTLKVTRDGLSSDMISLCREYSKGCRLYIDKIPVSIETEKIAEELGIEPVISALNGGDDFDFLFTVPITESEKVLSIEGISVIGHLTGMGDGCNLVLQDGSLSELRAPGWEE
jgi:thiamine-monophosphate kinase